MRFSVSVFFVYFLASCAYADFESLSLESEGKAEQLTSESERHLPQMMSGIQIVPDSEILLTDAMRKQAAQDLQELSEKGYKHSESPYPKQLLKIKERAEAEINENKDNLNPYDKHLKDSVEQIKLAFNFKGLKVVKPENVIGYAAAGGYQDGWDGVKAFFSDLHLGVCSVALHNIILSHSGAKLRKSSVSFKVNDKPTITSVEGSEQTGFLYTIAWYDSTFKHVFECANMSFDKTIADKMLAYAILIDHSLKQDQARSKSYRA